MAPITLWCNWLPIDVLITHRWPFDYSSTIILRTKDTFLAFLYSSWRNYAFAKVQIPFGMSRLKVNRRFLQICRQYWLFLILNCATTNTRTKFSHLQKMAIEAPYKESRYPSQGVIEECAKLNNLAGATVKVWFNGKLDRIKLEMLFILFLFVK